MPSLKSNSTDFTANQLSKIIQVLLSYISSEFAKYFMASGFAFAVDIGFLYLFSEIFGIHYLLSATLSFSLGILSAYILSISWVFEKRRLSDNRIELLMFVFIGIVGLGITALGLYLLTDIAGFHYMYSKILTAALVYGWNFSVRKAALFSLPRNLNHEK